MVAEGERAFLGLTHNPFVEPHRGFFDRGGRKTNLEQLRHLSEWSRRVLLVTGPEGVGKTTLYRELTATLEARVKAARIHAGLVNTGLEVLSAIAQGFGLAVRGDANTQSLRMDLIEHVQKQGDADRLCLALVDDAHLLDNKAVELLISLAHESALHLVLFGEVRMVPTIERAASARGVGWQEIRLTGYGEADARDYLEWRFQQARYRGRVPFTDGQVKDLIRLSGGLPGRVNQMANVLLAKLETGEAIEDRSGFPRLHAAVLALLVVVLGLLYVVFGEDPADAPSEVLALEEGPAPDASAEMQPDDGLIDPLAEASPSQAEADPAEADQAELDQAEADRAQVDPVRADQPQTEQVAQAPEARQLDDGAMATTPAEPIEMPEVERLPESDPVPGEDAAPTVAVQPVEVPAPVTEAVPAAPAGVKNTNWLLQQNSDYFTLQLVTVSAAERAAAFVARQREPGDFTIYQLTRDGRILHVVLYGLFSSRDAAQTAADSLPAEVGDIQPWIRQVGQVQAAARLSTLQ